MAKDEKTLCPCCHEVLVCKRCRKPLNADKLLITCSRCNSPADVNLSSEKAAVWLMYRAYGMEQKVVADRFDISQGRVSQICKEFEEQLPPLKELREAYSLADAYKYHKGIKSTNKPYVKKHTIFTLRNDDRDYVHAKSSRELEKIADEMLKLNSKTEKILAEREKKEKYFRDIESESKASKKKGKK